MRDKLTIEEYRAYIENTIIPSFNGLIDRDCYSVIINREHKIEICTNKSARSVGANSWQEQKGFCYLDGEDEALLESFFKGAFSGSAKEEIKLYVNKLILLQKKVLTTGIAIQFIDMLPYNNKFLTYITTYTPIFHPNGEILAIQSYSSESYVLRFQGHISDPHEVKSGNFTSSFTNREREMLFLLSNGATQEQISQILNISRGTVAAVISNQLCPKFGIAGANTRLLSEAAIKAGMYQHMPQSLWRPVLIILNADLVEEFAVNS